MYINKAFPLKDRKTNFSLVLRIAIFSICSWVTLSAAALFLTQSSSTLRHMIPATLPLVALIVFGTTKVSTIILTYTCINGVWQDLWQFICFRSRGEVSMIPTDFIPTARLHDTSLGGSFG